MTTAVEPREHSVEARGLRFHYVEWGAPDAPAMVLLHGISSHGRIWDPFARAFCDRYRLLALDQRGHGETTWPASPDYTTDDFVGDLEALVDLWGLDRFVLAGQSMGGMNAIAYAARHPDRVTHVIPVDIPPAVDRTRDPQRPVYEVIAKQGHPTWDSPEAAFAFMRGNNATIGDEALRHRLRYLLKQQPDGRWVERHDPRISYHWQPADLWEELPKVTAPVLIVRGGHSHALSAKTAERMRAAFPNAELYTSEAAGHTVVEDQPEEFVGAVAAFLGRYQPAATG
jgi:pimeloyl-ACP methyl ester carboxylesterase